MALNQYSDNERLGLAANWTEEAASNCTRAQASGLSKFRRERSPPHRLSPLANEFLLILNLLIDGPFHERPVLHLTGKFDNRVGMGLPSLGRDDAV